MISLDDCPVDYTCPSIDYIISSIEGVREDNIRLRDWGETCYEEALESQADVLRLQDKVDTLNGIIKALEDTIDCLK